MEPNYLSIPLSGGSFLGYIGSNQVGVSVVSGGSNTYIVNISNVPEQYAYYLSDNLSGASAPSGSSNSMHMNIIYSY